MRKRLIYCEQCGGTQLSGTGAFLVFHHLTFCCTDCRDDYRAADAERRDGRQPSTKRTRAA